MEFSPFSAKQLRALNWWCPGSPDAGRDAVICDGAVRSGKTLCLGISFVAWACGCFSGRSFALCGKTIRSLKRNLVTTLLPALSESGLLLQIQSRRKPARDRVRQKPQPVLPVRRERRRLGGADSGHHARGRFLRRSGADAAFVCGAGAGPMQRGRLEILVQLQPGKPAATGFTANGFRKAAGKKRAVSALHNGGQSVAEQSDAAALPKPLLRRVLRAVRARQMGCRRRACLPVHDGRDVLRRAGRRLFEEYAVSCDYGTVNPCSAGLWGRQGGTWYRVDEYYYDSRRDGRAAHRRRALRRARKALCRGRKLPALRSTRRRRAFSR